MAKEYLNPIAVAEQGIAEYIAEQPSVSGLFGGGNVPVYAATNESAGKIIRQKVELGLKQCVVVAFTSTSDAGVVAARLPVRATLLVSIHSPGLFADRSLKATSDLGVAIAESLHGVQFGDPFVPGYAVKFKSWDYERTDDGKVIARIEFEAVIYLTNK